MPPFVNCSRASRAYCRAVIEIHELSKTYRKKGGGTVKALDQVGFNAAGGSVHALLGPNGSGKTTLLRCVVGLLQADEGSIKLAGLDPTKDGDEVRQQLGFLTGSMKLPSRLTPREILDFFGKLRRMSGEHLKRQIEKVIDRLDIGGFADQRMESLSMGQKQRAGIAQAILHEPQILVLDEVTVGLDVLAAREIIELVREAADDGKTVLFSTHIMGEVTVLADSLSILHEGRLVYDGTLAHLDSVKGGASLEEEFIRRLRGDA